jgi:magnesium transporter
MDPARGATPMTRESPPAEPGPGDPTGAAARDSILDPWPLVRAIAWADGRVSRLEGRDAVAPFLANPEASVWVDVAAPSHAEIAGLDDLLRLHPLIAEDIAERNQRAKFEEIEGAIHVVMFWIAYAGGVAEIEVDIVLDRNRLITVHDPAWDPFSLPQLRGDGGHHLDRGVDFLLYAIADGIVDAYFPVLDALGDELDALQDDVIRNASAWTLERLFTLKRELIGLRRAITPAREIFNQLTNRDLALIAPEHLVYFRDVYDHLIRVTDELDNDRELVSGTLEVYLSTVNNNLSAIMKRLTGVTVILAGIGAVAGIFGMSEAGSALANGEAGGFWVVTGVIVALAAGVALVLRRADWI